MQISVPTYDKVTRSPSIPLGVTYVHDLEEMLNFMKLKFHEIAFQ